MKTAFEMRQDFIADKMFPATYPNRVKVCDAQDHPRTPCGAFAGGLSQHAGRVGTWVGYAGASHALVWLDGDDAPTPVMFVTCLD